MNETAYSFTIRELQSKALSFMNETYGFLHESEDKDAWYTRYGMLLDFAQQLPSLQLPLINRHRAD